MSLQFFLLFVLLTASNSKKLNEINLLFPLPPDVKDRNIPYILEAFDGCYEFESSKPDIISVVSEKENCVTKTIVSLIKSVAYDGSIWIYAREKGNKQILYFAL